MKILSIDWDVFFPDSLPYDWGHAEAPFYIEALWPVRASNRNQLTGEYALDEYVPTVPANFWNIVKNSPIAYISESHATLWRLLWGDNHVINLDAHHDCWAPQDPEKVDCSNWAYLGMDMGVITKYEVHYPEWRRGDSTGIEGKRVEKGFKKPHKLSYGLPEPSEYDMVFVCRSGAWTPPWYDDDFDAFIESSPFDFEVLGPALCERRMSIESARDLCVQQEKLLQSMMKEKVNA